MPWVMNNIHNEFVETKDASDYYLCPYRRIYDFKAEKDTGHIRLLNKYCKTSTGKQRFVLPVPYVSLDESSDVVNPEIYQQMIANSFMVLTKFANRYSKQWGKEYDNHCLDFLYPLRKDFFIFINIRLQMFVYKYFF